MRKMTCHAYWARGALAVATSVGVASAASAYRVDTNADPAERVTAIAHINDERAAHSIAQRPWPSVGSLRDARG